MGEARQLVPVWPDPAAQQVSHSSADEHSEVGSWTLLNVRDVCNGYYYSFGSTTATSIFQCNNLHFGDNIFTLYFGAATSTTLQATLTLVISTPTLVLQLKLPWCSSFKFGATISTSVTRI